MPPKAKSHVDKGKKKVVEDDSYHSPQQESLDTRDDMEQPVKKSDLAMMRETMALMQESLAQMNARIDIALKCSVPGGNLTSTPDTGSGIHRKRRRGTRSGVKNKKKAKSGNSDLRSFLDTKRKEGARNAGAEASKAPPSLLKGLLTPKFVMDLDMEPLPRNFTLPSLANYDGTTDPVEHLSQFIDQMYFCRVSDIVKCRALASTFTGAARKWYHSLPGRSLEGCEDFYHKFVSYFSTSKKAPKMTQSLASVVRHFDESIKSYLMRFCNEAAQVDRLNEEMASQCLLDGLRDNMLATLIYKTSGHNYQQCLKEAREYAISQEACGRVQPDIKSPSPAKDPEDEEVQESDSSGKIIRFSVTPSSQSTTKSM